MTVTQFVTEKMLCDLGAEMKNTGITNHQATSAASSHSLTQLQPLPTNLSTTVPRDSTPSTDHTCLSVPAPLRQLLQQDLDGLSLAVPTSSPSLTTNHQATSAASSPTFSVVNVMLTSDPCTNSSSVSFHSIPWHTSPFNVLRVAHRSA